MIKIGRGSHWVKFTLAALSFVESFLWTRHGMLDWFWEVQEIQVGIKTLLSLALRFSKVGGGGVIIVLLQ